MGIPKHDLLVAFQKVVGLKTVHAAAVDLHLTQAAITKRIQQLERDLAVSLFLRSRRGMALTEEGKALLQFCKTIEAAEGELAAKLTGNERQEVSLTIVGPTSFVATRLATACAPIHKKYPFLRLHLRSDDHLNLVEMVRRGEADLAVVPPSQVPNEMNSKVLRSDRYFLVSTPEWKGRQLKNIIEEERIIDFYESDATTLNYLKHFNLDTQAVKTRLYVNENEALIRYFVQGIGFGTLTEDIARPFLEEGTLIKLNGGKYFEDALALTWYARSKQMSYFEEVIRSIK